MKREQMATGGGSSGDAQRKYEKYVEGEEMQQLLEVINDSVVGQSARYDSDAKNSAIIAQLQSKHNEINKDDVNDEQQINEDDVDQQGIILYESEFDSIDYLDSSDVSLSSIVVSASELIATDVPTQSTTNATTSIPLIVVPSQQSIDRVETERTVVGVASTPQSSYDVSTSSSGATMWNKYSGRKLRERKNSKLQTKRKAIIDVSDGETSDTSGAKRAILRELGEIAFAAKRKQDEEIHMASIELARDKRRQTEELHELQMQQHREQHDIKMAILRAELARVAAPPPAESESQMDTSAEGQNNEKLQN